MIFIGTTPKQPTLFQPVTMDIDEIIDSLSMNIIDNPDDIFGMRSIINLEWYLLLKKSLFTQKLHGDADLYNYGVAKAPFEMDAGSIDHYLSRDFTIANLVEHIGIDNTRSLFESYEFEQIANNYEVVTFKQFFKMLLNPIPGNLYKPNPDTIIKVFDNGYAGVDKPMRMVDMTDVKILPLYLPDSQIERMLFSQLFSWLYSNPYAEIVDDNLPSQTAEQAEVLAKMTQVASEILKNMRGVLAKSAARIETTDAYLVKYNYD